MGRRSTTLTLGEGAHLAATRYPWGTKEYLRIPLTEAPANVTSLPVEMSIVPHNRHAADDDWHEAVWLYGEDTPTAALLIGPGTSLDLDVGTYIARVRVTADPETPIVEAGLVEIH